MNDLLLFIISIFALAFYYLIFNSDLFTNSVLSNFPSLVKTDNSGNLFPSLKGHIVILIFIILFHSFTYLLLINLL